MCSDLSGTVPDTGPWRAGVDRCDQKAVDTSCRENSRWASCWNPLPCQYRPRRHDRDWGSSRARSATGQCLDEDISRTRQSGPGHRPTANVGRRRFPHVDAPLIQALPLQSASHPAPALHCLPIFSPRAIQRKSGITNFRRPSTTSPNRPASLPSPIFFTKAFHCTR
jgi:hypothetical protein